MAKSVIVVIGHYSLRPIHLSKKILFARVFVFPFVEKKKPACIISPQQQSAELRGESSAAARTPPPPTLFPILRLSLTSLLREKFARSAPSAQAQTRRCAHTTFFGPEPFWPYTAGYNACVWECVCVSEEEISRAAPSACVWLRSRPREPIPSHVEAPAAAPRRRWIANLPDSGRLGFPSGI